MPKIQELSSSHPHSTHIEHRLTSLEVTQRERASANTHWQETMHGRVSYLERAVQGLIYAVMLLGVGKSGDLAELLLSIARSKL